MNKKYFRYLLTLSLILVLSPMVVGQGQGEVNRGMLEAELERLGELIQLADEAVRASSSVPAEVQLASAKALRDEASPIVLSQGSSPAELSAAGQMIRQARELAKSALASARYTQQKQDVVQRKLERANELLLRTREQLSLREKTQAMLTLYETAEDNLRNAWEFYRDGEYRPALKLANQVENAVRSMASAASRDAQGTGSYERYSESVKQLLESARNQIAECDSETAIKLIEEAQVSYNSARDMMSEDKPQPAMEALKTAKKLATRARLECSGFDGSLSERYERIMNEADAAAELVSTDNAEAQRLLEQVYRQLDLAEGYIADRQTQEAAASLKAAELSLNQLLKLLDVASTE